MNRRISTQRAQILGKIALVLVALLLTLPLGCRRSFPKENLDVFLWVYSESIVLSAGNHCERFAWSRSGEVTSSIDEICRKAPCRLIRRRQHGQRERNLSVILRWDSQDKALLLSIDGSENQGPDALEHAKGILSRKRRTNDAPVIVECGGDVPYGYVVQVWNLIREAGFSRIVASVFGAWYCYEGTGQAYLDAYVDKSSVRGDGLYGPRVNFMIYAPSGLHWKYVENLLFCIRHLGISEVQVFGSAGELLTICLYTEVDAGERYDDVEEEIEEEEEEEEEN